MAGSTFGEQVNGFGGYNSAVISVDAENLEATGLAEGSTTIEVYFSGSVYTLVQPEYYEENDHCDATPSYPSAQAGVQVRAPSGAPYYPTNFIQTNYQVNVSSNPNNVLGTITYHFSWTANQGPLSNLSDCQVGEFVKYAGYVPGQQLTYHWPVPFPSASSPNPTLVLPVPKNGPSGAGGDVPPS